MLVGDKTTTLLGGGRKAKTRWRAMGRNGPGAIGFDWCRLLVKSLEFLRSWPRLSRLCVQARIYMSDAKACGERSHLAVVDVLMSIRAMRASGLHLLAEQGETMVRTQV